MNSIRYLIFHAHRVVRPGAVAISVVWALLGCTPQYDWRDVRNEAPAWIATFPGKQVQVAREISLPPIKAPVTLTLASSRIKNTMFAVGWVSGPTLDSKTLEQVRSALEVAMLKNIEAEESTVQRTENPPAVALGNRSIRQIYAQGRLQLDRNNSAEALLWMRTLTVSAPIPFVLEIIAVGPKEHLNEELALQFIESLRLP